MMRSIPDGLSGGAMTYAHCWRLTRRDGVILGFTDHDADLVIDGVTYAALTGLVAFDLTSAQGFAVTGGDVSGALQSAGLVERDIAAGLYDRAAIALYRVDWTRPEQHLVVFSGLIGEIKRNGGEFIAELRSVAALYQEEKGRLYQRICSAEFGDARCGVDLGRAEFRYQAQISATDGTSYFECDADPARYDFNNGKVEFTAGRNQSTLIDVKSHIAQSGQSGLWLWRAAPFPLAMGDPVTLTIGCDKSFATCRTRFANQKNFRGFPHMPGNDLVLRVAQNGDAALDGGSLFNV